MKKFAMAVLGSALACGSAFAQVVPVVPGPPPPLSPKAAAPGAVGGIPPSIYAATTVTKFLAICGSDQGGCADKVGTALMDKMTFNGTANICLPGPDYAPGAITWLKAHPETGDLQTEDGIYLALQKAYPCG